LISLPMSQTYTTIHIPPFLAHHTTSDTDPVQNSPLLRVLVPSCLIIPCTSTRSHVKSRDTYGSHHDIDGGGIDNNVHWFQICENVYAREQFEKPSITKERG